MVRTNGPEEEKEEKDEIVLIHRLELMDVVLIFY